MANLEARTFSKNRGQVFEQVGDRTSARVDHLKAIALDKMDDAAYRRLGVIETEDGDSHAATHVYRDPGPDRESQDEVRLPTTGTTTA